MRVKLDGAEYNLNSIGMFKMALAFFNTKSLLASEKGEHERAKGYLDQAFEIENEFRKFKTKC